MNYGCIDVDEEVFNGLVCRIIGMEGVDFVIDCRPQSHWGLLNKESYVDFVSYPIPETVYQLENSCYLHHPIAELRIYRGADYGRSRYWEGYSMFWCPQYLRSLNINQVTDLPLIYR